MPNSSMCSNSRRAIRRHSGERRRAREDTGGPVVLMCVCLGGSELDCGRVREGKSARRAEKSFVGIRGRIEGLGVDALEYMPWIVNWVRASTKRQ